MSQRDGKLQNYKFFFDYFLFYYFYNNLKINPLNENVNLKNEST